MATDATTSAPTPDETERTRTGQWFRPPVDIIETADELLLLADLPGANSESIDIGFEDGTLTIEGQVKPRYGDKWNFLLAEYGVGDFRRSFRVSEQIDADRIHAEFTDGVLTVHLPKAEAARPRKIQVQVAS